jgi:hypothetical protein
LVAAAFDGGFVVFLPGFAVAGFPFATVFVAGFRPDPRDAAMRAMLRDQRLARAVTVINRPR